MKKIFLLLLILSSAVLLSGCTKKEVPGGGTPEEPTAMPTKPVEQSIKERPYVALNLSNDNHWITIEAKNIVKGTTGLEYELIYLVDVQGEKIERGVGTAGKPADLNGQTEFTKKLLLGSASCTTGTCKYKYDEGITEGSLSLKLLTPQGTEKYDSAFRIQKGKEAIDGLTTGDGVFTLISSGLPAKATYLTISSIGVPVSLPQGVTAKTIPYAVFPGVSGKGTVSFTTSLSDVAIYAYSNKSWQKLTTKIESGKASADFSGASLFILGQ